MNAPTRFAGIVLAALLLAGPVRATDHEVPDFAFSEPQLAQLLAPIALYPDALLAQVLMASTYPLEVVQAARWTRDNPGLDGQEAVEAVVAWDWDPSVKALVAFPEVLQRMDADLAWTQRLGDAFLGQEQQVLQTVQVLRQQAAEAGNLDTLEHVVVEREREVIYIEPERPEILYVPYYDPRVIYGAWWWPAYPPIVWYDMPRHQHYVHVRWSPAIHVAPLFYFGLFDWYDYRVLTFYDRYDYPRRTSRYSYQDATRWRHDPQHRRGVAYRDPVRQHEYRQQRSRLYTLDSRTGQLVAPRDTQRIFSRATESEPSAPQRDGHRQERDRSSLVDRTRAVEQRDRSAERQRRATASPELSVNGTATPRGDRVDGSAALRQSRPGAPAQDTRRATAAPRRALPERQTQRAVPRRAPQAVERTAPRRAPQAVERAAPRQAPQTVERAAPRQNRDVPRRQVGPQRQAGAAARPNPPSGMFTRQREAGPPAGRQVQAPARPTGQPAVSAAPRRHGERTAESARALRDEESSRPAGSTRDTAPSRRALGNYRR